MYTMQNVQNMQKSLLLTERTSALWAVYGYFLKLELLKPTVPDDCFKLLSPEAKTAALWGPKGIRGGFLLDAL